MRYEIVEYDASLSFDELSESNLLEVRASFDDEGLTSVFITPTEIQYSGYSGRDPDRYVLEVFRRAAAAIGNAAGQIKVALIDTRDEETFETYEVRYGQLIRIFPGVKFHSAYESEGGP